MLKLSTIVVTYNRLKLNRHFVESYRATVPHNEHELIVVDNASTDGTVLWLQEAKNEQTINQLILNPVNYHLGKAFNQGLVVSDPSCAYIGKFDNDCYFEKGWYQNCQEVLETVQPDVLIVSTTPKSRTGFVQQEKGVSFLKWQNDIGGSYYIKRTFLEQHNLRLSEKVWGTHHTGPNPTFFRRVHRLRGKVIRLLPPWVTRKYERFTDPEYQEYYKETFGARGIENTLHRLQHEENQSAKK